MRTVYAITLEVEPRVDDSSIDVFEQLRSRCQSWITSKYRQRWNHELAFGADDEHSEPLPQHSVRVYERNSVSGRLYVLEWSHPHDEDPASIWNTVITIAKHGATVELSTVIRVASIQAVIRPVEFSLGRPRFLTEVIDAFCVTHNGRQLQQSPAKIATSDVATFVNDELLSTNRLDPIIVVAPDVLTDAPLVDPSAILAKIGEFAKVSVLKSRWAAFDLTDALGKSLSCFNGAVRIYWPGFTRGSWPFDHPLVLGRAIRPGVEGTEFIGRMLFRQLAAVSAFRHVEGAATRSIRQELADSDKSAIERLRQDARSGTADREKLEEDLVIALIKVDELEAERDNLRNELDAQKSLWAWYQSFRPMSEDTSDEGVNVFQREWQPEYQSVAEALAAAKQHFSGPLIFLESAEQSAIASPFHRPQRVYELFRALHEVSTEWRGNAGKLGMSWKDALAERGFEYKEHISQTSEGKWGAEYRFKWKGKLVLFSQHVTIGAKQADKCLSVHLYRDEQDYVIVIGHCGRHLTNTRT